VSVRPIICKAQYLYSNITTQSDGDHSSTSVTWQPDITFGQFKRSLKTFMFGQMGRSALYLNAKGVD